MVNNSLKYSIKYVGFSKKGKCEKNSNNGYTVDGGFSRSSQNIYVCIKNYF